MSDLNNTSTSLDRWRSLSELHPELPVIDPPVDHQFDLMKLRSGFDRRHFLEVMGASVALGGAAGCRPQPTEKIVPYAKLPEQIVPGRPLFFATTMSYSGRSIGLLVESHEGRPTKVEGNPQHPASLGATDSIAQASILSLYDPERAQAVTNIGEAATWEGYLADLRDALQAQAPRQGAGLRLLTETIVSPTLGRQIKEVLAQFPKAKWHQYDAGHADGAVVATQKLFGRALQAVPQFDKADVVVSLDADFISGLNGSVAFTRNVMSRRDVSAGQKAMSRLYLAETGVSSTGTIVDHRLPVTPSQLLAVAQGLAAGVGIAGFESVSTASLGEAAKTWLSIAVEDLKAASGKSLVVAADNAPWQVHAIAALLNESLGNVGQTLNYIESPEVEPSNQIASLAELHQDLTSGQVEVVLIAGVNPVYNAPADLDFGAALKNVKRLVAQISSHFDETSEFCHWHIPQSHFLESWSDARAFDGTVSIVQPLIAPLFDSRSIHDFVSAATGKPVVTAYDAVRETWKDLGGEGGFEAAWKTAIHDGLVAKSASAPVAVSAKTAAEDLVTLQTAVAAGSEDKFEVKFDLDPTIWDGRFANNAWLQELPKPWTRLVWENAVLISPAAAKRLRLREGDRVELKAGDRTVVGPVWITPGHADGVVTAHIGHGRKAGGKLASKYGFNANLIRTRNASSVATGVTITAAGGRDRLACTQTHHSIEGRDIVRKVTLEDFVKGGTGSPGHHHSDIQKPPSLYPDWEYNDRAWGMVVDLSKCSGCNACVVACQSENNIPVVGKSGVLMGREMHWLRIDRYFSGTEDNPEVLQQPMMCQHCEHAPCETVCPVAATSHSPEGLNEMTYNRCIGTRYCSNNCPYKVRRFNFLSYVDYDTPLAELRSNPDVTVRTRGVMEKCTYCVQRISAARIQTSIESAKSGKPQKMADGAVVTACQSACAAQAIAFGDLNDKESQVAKWAALPHNYGVLVELGTRPRTTYLSRVTNPNPKVAPKADDSHGHGHASVEGSGAAAALS